MEKLDERLGDKIEIIAVNVWINESEEKIEKYIEEKGLKITSVIDRKGEMLRSFGIFATPTQIIIDRRGTVRYLDSAVPDDIDKHMAELLR